MILTAALLIVAADQGRRGWRLQQQASRVAVEQADLSASVANLVRANEEAQARAAVEPPYARDAAAIAKMAAFQSSHALQSLEAARVEGVRVTEIEMSAAEGTVRVQVEFSAHEALQRYVGDLNAGEPRRTWSLLQAQAPPSSGAPGTATIAASCVQLDH